jgi:hypothetical protein
VDKTPNHAARKGQALEAAMPFSYCTRNLQIFQGSLIADFTFQAIYKNPHLFPRLEPRLLPAFRMAMAIACLCGRPS